MKFQNLSSSTIALSSSITSAWSKVAPRREPSSTIGFTGDERRKLRTNILKYKAIIIVAILIFIAFIGGRISAGPTQNTIADSRAAAPTAKAEQTLNKDFSFDIKDAKGTTVSTFTYTLQNAQLLDQILVKGQRATAVKGKTFLVVNLKIANNHTQGIQINSKDYIRLSRNKTAERIAPDIHNDPVEAQAISTKYTRLGFSINDTDKDLVLYIGEIKGDKKPITLHLKKI